MHVKKISDVIGSEVYTDLGDYFGQVEEANLQENKVDGWRINRSDLPSPGSEPEEEITEEPA
jgi:sporulation protein YlmC with PRC-barrel domain